jgi:Secretion system C-terminal sorting domain
MKNLKLLLALTSLPLLTFSQADNWNEIESTGFGDVNNYGIHEFMVFKDTIYACVGHKFAGIAEIQRSGTGDIGDWASVSYDDTTTTVKGIPSINTYKDSIMWIATANPFQGTVVYRTLNGIDWVPISDPGFGNFERWSSTPNMVVFQGSADTIPYLYAAANTHGGSFASEIRRIPFYSVNPADWVTVIDFDTRDPNCNQITYFQTWNDTIYFGSNGDSLMYQSGDGTNFVANAAVQTSFHPADLLIACMEVFNGYFYAATNNPAVGGKLFRSSDMYNWQDMTDSLENYDPNRDFEIHNLDISNGYLWITSYPDTAVSNGCPVWRSSNGSGDYFLQSNVDGFSNPDNDGENSVTIGFKNRQYYGGPNFQAGGQIWRTDIVLSNSNFEDDCDFKLYPNPVKRTGELKISGLCDQAQVIHIYDLSGRLMGSFENDDQISLRTLKIQNGLYILSFQDQNGNLKSFRFIAE